ncbi:MAG: hypothetical protein J6M25_01545 [Prevotella sp.]|nr:hypothetical protein [Prevotella sp.]
MKKIYLKPLTEETNIFVENAILAGSPVDWSNEPGDPGFGDDEGGDDEGPDWSRRKRHSEWDDEDEM